MTVVGRNRMESSWMVSIDWFVFFCISMTASIAFAAALDGGPRGDGPDAPFAARRNDAWKVIGPGGGGAQFLPAISPQDPSRVIVNCDMTDSFITRNGGKSWRMFNLRAPVRLVVWDPLNADVVYARTNYLFRSADCGRTWQLVHPEPRKVKSLIHCGDHAGSVIVTTDGSTETVQALAADPGDSTKLYAAIEAGTVALCFSDDWGRSWTKVTELPGACEKIYIDPRSPGEDRTIYVVGANCVSIRAGGAWTQRKGPQGVTRFGGVSAGFPSGDAEAVMYAVSGRARRGSGGVSGVFVSRDGAATWDNCTEKIAATLGDDEGTLSFMAIAASPTIPEVAYVSCKTPGRDAVGRGSRIYVLKTGDAGRTWKAVWRDVDDKPGENVHDAWTNERYGPWWGDAPLGLDVAATDPRICFATDLGRTMRTTDGGATWEACYSRRMDDGGWSTTGIDVSCCYAVHFDPFDSKRMFVSYTDFGLFASENGGSNWKSATTGGVPDGWLNSTYWVEFDPEVKGLMWAVMSGVHDLPRPKMWRSGGAVHQNGGVLVSTDGGTSWKVTSSGIGEVTPTHVLLDAESPKDSRTLYVCGFGRGVFKSTDNGKTWAAKNEGIEGGAPLAWRITRAAGGTLYLVVFRKTEDGSIGNAGDGAIYRSADGAEHWQKLALPRGTNGPMSLVVDPSDAKRLCLGAWGVANWETGDTGGGIFVSKDAGKTWRCTLGKDQHIHDVTVDERNGAYYACGFESNAWRSTDKGETWTRIKGYNFKWGRRVIPDPNDPEMVYVSTFGGSVWYGPAEGDPEAPEDIVTKALKY